MTAATQTYATHRKFVPAFHFVVMPILLGNVGLVAWRLWQAPGGAAVWALLVAVAILGGALFGRMFALAAQDRVIRLEERLRMREVLPADLQGRIPEFSRDQLIALRFASDGELPALAAVVLRDGLHARADIKKRVTRWRADDHQL